MPHPCARLNSSALPPPGWLGRSRERGGTSAAAVPGPSEARCSGAVGFWSPCPAELIGGRGNGLIRTTGTAMEHQMHRAAMGMGEKLQGDQGHGPGEITAATGHDHQGRGLWMQRKADTMQRLGLLHGKESSSEIEQ